VDENVRHDHEAGFVFIVAVATAVTNYCYINAVLGKNVAMHS
jgi:hypothetical protein